jgi:hypothetical protein
VNDGAPGAFRAAPVRSDFERAQGHPVGLEIVAATLKTSCPPGVRPSYWPRAKVERQNGSAIKRLNSAAGFHQERFAIKDLSLRVKSANPQGTESLRRLERVCDSSFRIPTIKDGVRTSAIPALPRGPNDNGESYGKGPTGAPVGTQERNSLVARAHAMLSGQPDHNRPGTTPPISPCSAVGSSPCIIRIQHHAGRVRAGSQEPPLRVVACGLDAPAARFVLGLAAAPPNPE